MAEEHYRVHGKLEPHEELANAIVIQAARDYRGALRRLKKNPGNRCALGTKNEVERFFRSQWYELLTNMDGEYLIRKLKEELENDSEGISGTG